MEAVHELTEMLLVTPRKNEESTSGGNDNDHSAKSLHAGGGHSALLTTGGDLYLWGWNDAGQLGRTTTLLQSKFTTKSYFTPKLPLPNIQVETVSLGHTHTFVIERGTGHLYGFGDNGRGQVTGCVEGANGTNDMYHVPRTPLGLSEECFVDAAAGLFHSAAVTVQGELITWGCGRFGQCLPVVDLVDRRDHNRDASSTVGKWRPPDGSKLLKVACGRRHTIILDEHGRVWTLGDNKYGQLGRSSSESDSKDDEPHLVDGPLGHMDSGCFAIYSGWSHVLALSRNEDSNDVTVHGWGRNDKSQLGLSSTHSRVFIPRDLLKPSINSSKKWINGMNVFIQSADCGSESSHILDIHGNIYSTGWNEHGNLGIGRNRAKESGEHRSLWKKMSGVSVVAPPTNRAKNVLFAAGGAHCIVMAV
jgi:alpha-tubulin suppressor-like RCC1 family protein